MGYVSLGELILTEISQNPSNINAYEDLFCHIRNLYEEGNDEGYRLNKMLMREVQRNLHRDVIRLTEVYKHTLLIDSHLSFDSYLQYLEWNRKPSERFYLPRRKALREHIEALQMLEDGELDELFLSQPARTGKTTLAMMFVSWIIGKHPEMSNLYSAFSDTITKAFYNGVLEICQDPTYTWKEIFPDAKIVQTDAQNETININRKKRYASITSRSLYGTLNGSCDCNGYLIADDLISGIEEAMNKDRLVSAWGKVDNNLLPRAKESAKLLWWGTRWSVADPIGNRLDILENEPQFKSRRYKVINIPALDDNDESNFDYDYGVGFSTDFYRQRRASFERNNDMASWFAQYMGVPIEREGTLFSPDDFRYYNGILPPTMPDRIFMAVDPSWGGGDFVAAPICYQYDEDIYVADVVYDNGDKRITQPLLTSAIINHKVQAVQFECNKMTESYKDEVDRALRGKGYRCNLMGKPAPTNKGKEQRIFDAAPEIREHFIFLESGYRSKHYNQFLQNVYGFKMYGKNDHDDAPDSLSMARDMAFSRKIRAGVFKRTF